jgi:hypothetical protein
VLLKLSAWRAAVLLKLSAWRAAVVEAYMMSAFRAHVWKIEGVPAP